MKKTSRYLVALVLTLTWTSPGFADDAKKNAFDRAAEFALSLPPEQDMQEAAVQLVGMVASWQGGSLKDQLTARQLGLMKKKSRFLTMKVQQGEKVTVADVIAASQEDVKTATLGGVDLFVLGLAVVALYSTAIYMACTKIHPSPRTRETVRRCFGEKRVRQLEEFFGIAEAEAEENQEPKREWKESELPDHSVTPETDYWMAPGPVHIDPGW